MRIFKTKWLARFARHEGITDQSLREAIERAERGLVDADLGGGLIKLRVARQGKGRSGGFRMIVAYRVKDLAVFLSGFAKSDREDLGPDELAIAHAVAASWLSADHTRVEQALREGKLVEVIE